MAIIYHVTTAHEWTAAHEKGYYSASSLKTEGFIHCSTAEQVAGVLERYFAGKKNLVKLSIDTDKLASALQYDLSPSLREEFPHVYGEINPDAVIHVENIQTN
jgi:uncharacterized protein (DUF952 family)